MRKEAKIGIFSTMVILTIIVNLDNIFNALTRFFLTGIIPGTQIALPSLLMFTVSVLAISVMITRALRHYLPEKYLAKKTASKFIQIKT